MFSLPAKVMFFQINNSLLSYKTILATLDGDFKVFREVIPKQTSLLSNGCHFEIYRSIVSPMYHVFVCVFLNILIRLQTKEITQSKMQHHHQAQTS